MSIGGAREGGGAREVGGGEAERAHSKPANITTGNATILSPHAPHARVQRRRIRCMRCTSDTSDESARAAYAACIRACVRACACGMYAACSVCGMHTRMYTRMCIYYVMHVAPLGGEAARTRQLSIVYHS